LWLDAVGASVDDRAMAKSSFACAFTLGIAVVIGCASQQQTAPEPQTGPPGVDIEYNDRKESAEPKSDGAEPEATESKSTKEEEKSVPKEPDEGKAPPPKKSCDGLKKTQCEVTVGCAWSSDKKCVSQ
jgi:hypothetical protein